MTLTKEHKLMQMIIGKSWEDEAFEQELVANPISVIEKLTGEKVVLPEGRKLIVRDYTDARTIYINIPPNHNQKALR